MSDYPIGHVSYPGKAWSLSEPLKEQSFKGRLVGVWNCTPLLESFILSQHSFEVLDGLVLGIGNYVTKLGTNKV